jgi:hypothetical protein
MQVNSASSDDALPFPKREVRRLASHDIAPMAINPSERPCLPSVEKIWDPKGEAIAPLRVLTSGEDVQALFLGDQAARAGDKCLGYGEAVVGFQTPLVRIRQAENGEHFVLWVSGLAFAPAED